VAYLFGAFLVFTGLKLLVQQSEEVHPERNPLYRLFCRLVPTVYGYRGGRFLVREGGRLDKSRPRDYAWDYVVAATAAAFPWILCALYFVYVMAPLHVLLITLLSNLGKMFPALCYRTEAGFRERLALAIAMFPRGEVGAGVLVVSLSYGLAGPALTVAVLSLALNRQHWQRVGVRKSLTHPEGAW